MVIFQGIPTTEVDVIFVLTNIFYQPICFDQYIFSLCINFILPTILSIQMTFISLKNISDHSNLEKSLYPILHSYLHFTTLILSSLIFFKIEKKITCKTLSISNSFSFSSMFLSRFFVFLE